jgi:hypothetical protein
VRRVPALVLKHHPHRTLTHLDRVPPRPLRTRHLLILSSGRAVTNPGAVQFAETDHPFGDRSGGRGRRPGNVNQVEAAIARLHGLDQEQVRRIMWQNLATLVRVTRCGSLLPRTVRLTLAALT